MKLSSVKNKCNNCILILSLLAQLIFITASSPVYISFGQVETYKTFITRTLPILYKNSQIEYYLSSMNEKKPVAEIEPDPYFLCKMTGDKGFTHFNIKKLSVTGLSVIILFFGHVIKRKNRYKALIAHNLGGHAPPSGISLPV